MTRYRVKNLDAVCLVTAGLILGTLLGAHAHPYPVTLLVLFEFVGGIIGFLLLQLLDAARQGRKWGPDNENSDPDGQL